MTSNHDNALAKASEIGAEHGRNAASWVTDGNTTLDTYRALLAGIEDGDPMVLDALPSPDLSDESVAGVEGEWLEGREDWSWGEIIDLQGEYEQAFTDAVESEITRVCRLQLEADENVH